MIKLYKKNNDKLEYCEYWLNEAENLLYVHKGLVGENGTYFTKKCRNEEKFALKFTKKCKKQGFFEIEDEFKHEIVVQFQFKTKLDEKSVDTLYQFIANILNELLGWSGLGEVDGYDFGISTKPNEKVFHLNIYNLVVDSEIALPMIVKALPKEFGEARVAVR